MAKGDRQDFINRDKAVSDIGQRRSQKLFGESGDLRHMLTQIALQNLQQTQPLVGASTNYLMQRFQDPSGIGFSPRQDLPVIGTNPLGRGQGY